MSRVDHKHQPNPSKMENIAESSQGNHQNGNSNPIWSDYQILCRLFVLMTCIKILLIPTYHSTDFEVHRNWLAITYNLPLNEWYINGISQWTLDYPPLFAWFEYFLSQIAALVEPEMLKIQNLNYASYKTILFQRVSVIVTDFVYFYGIKELGKASYQFQHSCKTFNILSICNMGLLIVDHIHFQYNGFLLGILLLSIARISEITKPTSVLKGAAYFAILLNLKHIYLYIAPVFGIWLLKWCAIKNGEFFQRFSALGMIVLSVFVISLGPFFSQLPQVLSRLFPFKRGLIHAYWAANGWALYVGMDKILSKIFNHFQWISKPRDAILTGGLVQEESLTVLPTPSPLITLIVTCLSMLPSICLLLWNRNSIFKAKCLIRCIVICGLCSFMFGWHVHEKAVLTAIIPLCSIAATDTRDAKVFIILSSSGYTALLPLLYPSNLTPLKILVLILHLFLIWTVLSKNFQKSLLNFHEKLYIGLLPLLTVYETILHKLIFGEQLPFLPLAITSLYCAVGITYSWLLYYYIFFQDTIHSSYKKIENKKHDKVLTHKKQKKS